jgi:hypothetical protein
MPSSSDATDRLRTHLRAARSAAASHPAPEELFAYHLGQLSPAVEEALREHLVGCRDCAAIVLELATFLEGEEAPGSDLPAIDLKAAWRRNRAASSSGDSGPVRAPDRRAARPRLAWAVAAGLALVSTLLGFEVVDQGRTLARLRRPQANPPLVNLVPVGSLRSTTDRPAELRFAPQVERAWIILNAEAELDSPPYRVEVIAATGLAVLRIDDLEGSEAGNLRIELPRDLIPPGSYRLLLTRAGEATRQVVAEFEIAVLAGVPSPP